MKDQVQALVLRSFPQGERNLILRLYTREYGRMSFIVTAAQSGKKGGVSRSLFQPLNLLALTFQVSRKSDLHRITEAQMLFHFQAMGQEPVKNCLVLFIAEFLQQVISDQGEGDQALFDFLKEAIFRLNQSAAPLANFHLALLMRLLDYMGLSPALRRDHERYFDLLRGSYADQEPWHSHFIQGLLLEQWQMLQSCSWDQVQEWDLPGKQRQELLTALLDYYRLHVYDFGTLRSRSILREVLS